MDLILRARAGFETAPTAAPTCPSFFLFWICWLAFFFPDTSTNLSYIVTDKSRTSVLQTMTVIERWNGHIFQVLRGPLRSSHQSLLHGIPGNGREQRLAPSGSKCCCNKVLTLSNVVYWQLDLLWYKKKYMSNRLTADPGKANIHTFIRN